MKRLLLLSKGLARYRHTFTEHLATSLAGHVQIIAAPLGDDLWEVDYPALKKSAGLVHYIDFPQSWAELNQLSPDLVCIMEYSPAMLRVLFWAKARRLPVIVATEIGAGQPYQQDIGLKTRLLHKLMAHFTDGQLAFSPAACVPFGARHRPIHFAPHSIDTTEFTTKRWSDSSQHTPVILTVAQYHPRKGLDLMAAALAEIKDKYDFQWRIIGILDPSWLQQQVQKHGLQNQAVITGSIQGEALVQEFKGADLFVLPSRFDTYGVVTQEAAACGLPMLISRYAGSSQNLVEANQNGQVIDPYDTANFSQSIVELLSQPALRERQGKHSRALAEKWCVRHNAQSTANWLTTQFF